MDKLFIKTPYFFVKFSFINRNDLVNFNEFFNIFFYTLTYKNLEI